MLYFVTLSSPWPGGHRGSYRGPGRGCELRQGHWDGEEGAEQEAFRKQAHRDMEIGRAGSAGGRIAEDHSVHFLSLL